MKHPEQKRTDEISIMWSGNTVIAIGYKCSKCGEHLFPLGSTFPDEMLKEQQKMQLDVINKDCN